jgi:very-short-patch-repair endonuclease
LERSYPELQSTVEILVAIWLVKHDILFVTQEKYFGGTTIPGGAVVDFVLPDRRIIIRVQSYWHLMAEAVARDELQKIKLTADGFTVVDVWEEALLKNVDYVMREAVEGREVAKA